MTPVCKTYPILPLMHRDILSGESDVLIPCIILITFVVSYSIHSIVLANFGRASNMLPSCQRRYVILT